VCRTFAGGRQESWQGGDSGNRPGARRNQSRDLSGRAASRSDRMRTPPGGSQRDVAIERHVVRAIDDTHSARADLAEQLASADSFTDGKSHDVLSLIRLAQGAQHRDVEADRTMART
jgi:hypothetical protein